MNGTDGTAGEFVYFGLEKWLNKHFLHDLHYLSDIFLQFNVDGMTLFNSSSKKNCKRVVSYPRNKYCKEKTNVSFRNQRQSCHHTGYSSLLNIKPPIDMIICLPLDYMHLACLGIMKKLYLDFWVQWKEKEIEKEWEELEREIKKCILERKRGKRKELGKRYIRKRKEYRDMCEKKKEEYRIEERSEVENIKTEEQTWKFINKGRKKRVEISREINIEEWEKHFMEVLGGERKEERKEKTKRKQRNDREIREEEVRREIKRLKRGKAAGADELRNEVWLAGGVKVEKKLKEVINKVWKGEGFPDKWRVGVVVPIWKRGERNIVSNYRGVTRIRHIKYTRLY
ncbi:hypothetical protein ALC62_02276 [Cyphomyrmex costatus]|uniref:Endonuclease/exonuclease/phosphatase domain-containing protein n=1 Tax=Cyphomyrmex costatus TaxID=456900 RepID=A0A151INF6_9HYME|nr:hypothetical protein ALC62_02276 [Cyphomyrmex costatus]